jgi:hypothetical protein
MYRLLFLLLVGCSPSYYVGHVVSIERNARRVNVEITNRHYIMAVAEERDTLSVGQEVKVDKKTLYIIK